MKKSFIYSLLPALFTMFATAFFTSCSGDDESMPFWGLNYEQPNRLSQNFFKIAGATFVDEAMPGNTIEQTLTSIYPGNINSQAGQSVTIEIASNIELDKFYIGAQDIQNPNNNNGYYTVNAIKNSTSAGLHIYKVTFDFVKNANTDFIITICGMNTADNGETQITKTSKIITYLEPTIAKNAIIGEWEGFSTDENGSQDYLYYEFKTDGSGLMLTSNGRENFEYNYATATGELRITTTNGESIWCTIWFSIDRKTMNVVENKRYNPETEEFQETKLEYTLTKIEE